MTIAMVLLAYAAAVAAAGTWWLPRAAWPARAPRTGIVVWQALSLTVVTSAVVAGLILALPCLQIVTGSAGVEASVAVLLPHYGTAGGVAAGAVGGVLALAIAGRLAWFTMSALAGGARRRARHDDTLALVARPGPAPGLMLLEDDQPAAYCLPGRRRIVLTTGAMRLLDSRQLDAVLAHEQAHLASRHHLVLAFAAALSGAFPRMRLFAVAADHTSRLVEMAADDAATRRAHRLTLAGALLALAATRAPARAAPPGALGAGETAAAQRVRRLIEPPRPVSRAQRAAVRAAALAAAPALMLSAPALAVLSIPHCPSSSVHPSAVATAQHSLPCTGPCSSS